MMWALLDAEPIFVLENPQLDWGFSLALAVINRQKTSLFDII